MGKDWYPDCWKSREWRLNHLYWIERKSDAPCRFRMNSAQRDFFENMWYRNIILKARQLGFSTLVALLILDGCLFNNNWKAGINDKKLEDAKEKLGKIKFAYEALADPPDGLDWVEDPEDRRNIIMFAKQVHDMAKGIITESSAKFAGNSSVIIGVEIRGGTRQFLHVSEFGYVAAHDPGKAKNILAGSLNSVDKNCVVIMESTHEGGRFGEHYRLLRSAMEKSGTKLTQLDNKFFFYPWWKEPRYSLDVTPDMRPLTNEQTRYFRELETQHGITLTDGQKRWYSSQWELFGVLVRQEYPSTPDEAFETQAEGSIYGSIITDLRASGRIGRTFEASDNLPLYVSWDIGLADYNSLWLIQPGADGLFYVLDSYTANNQPFSHYISVIRRWEAIHGQAIKRQLVPHDGAKRDDNLMTYDAKLAAQGLPALRVPRTSDIWKGIEATRKLLRHCVFHARCSEPVKVDTAEYPSGLNALENYRTAPPGAHGVLRPMPLHDNSSHAADAFRCFAEAFALGLVSRDTSPATPHQWREKGIRAGMARGVPWAR